MTETAASYVQLTTPDQVTGSLVEELASCWVEVTNAGGAAGFPFPPVDLSRTAPAVEAIAAALAPETSRLLLVRVEGELAGWLNVRRDPFALIRHWGTLHHVQTRPAFRGCGLGTRLMHEVRTLAREGMGLEQLHLAARAGMGLEDFYGRLGWKEIGRWPGALRLGPGDDRDEVLMVLSPL
ncbi:GNAT family N-acetyltransferase [Streptomyces sp. BBFR102]|uniref:GNAT family N-acetyltransferase n=1 Tax=Streptomyces sp. BBFR102 TaxID=3448171 RepID=UPI003F52F84A